MKIPRISKYSIVIALKMKALSMIQRYCAFTNPSFRNVLLLIQLFSNGLKVTGLPSEMKFLVLILLNAKLLLRI